MPFILSQMLDFCRWAGALLVLAVHSTNIFVSLKDIMDAPHAPPVYAWWFIATFELGHQAVIGFFVMSGYLVGGAVLRSIRQQKDFLREYLIHRFARIYVVTVPALVLTFVADAIGRNFLPENGFYDSELYRGHFDLAVLAGNVLNFQEIFVPFYGTNSPLWTLACEFWYYISFALLAAPLARYYPRTLRFGGFALGAAIFLFFGAASEWFRFGFLLWVIGALASLLTRPLIASRWGALSLYVAALIPIRLLVRGPLLAAHPWLLEAADLVGTLLFSNLMLTVRHAPTDGWDLLRPACHRTLADFSFSLYSIHMPLLVLLRAAADSIMGPRWAGELATPGHWATLAAVMSVILAVAFGFSRLTEAHTGAARRYLSAVLPRYALAPG
jgi:peptidoglycan/LPS O-acetylase OafA/YrhL